MTKARMAGAGALLAGLGLAGSAVAGEISRRAYESSFEGDNGGWTASAEGGGESDFQRGVPSQTAFGGDLPLPSIVDNGPPFAIDGDRVWGTRLSEVYTNGRVSRLSQTFDFSASGLNVKNGVLTWFQFAHMWPGDNVRVLVNGDVVYQLRGSLKMPPEKDTMMMVPADRGEPQIEWEGVEVDLSAYDGLASVEIVFEFAADGRGNAPGFYLDDVVIFSDVTPRNDDVGYQWRVQPGAGLCRSSTAPFTVEGMIVNNSSTPATGVTAQGTLPPNTSFSAAGSDPAIQHSGDPSGGLWQYPAGTLNPFETRSFILEVTPDGTVGSATFGGCASSDFADTETANDCDSMSVELKRQTDLKVDLFGDAGATCDSPFDYQLRITNEGPSESSGAAWSVTLPEDVVFVSSSAGGHDGSPTGGVVSGVAPALMTGTTTEIDIETMTVATPSLPKLCAHAEAEPASTTDCDSITFNNTGDWSVFFDGSDVGLDIVAGTGGLEDQVGAPLSYVHPASHPDRRHGSLFRPHVSPDGDTVAFRSFLGSGSPPNELAMYFDGSDVGLDVATAIAVPGDMGDDSGRTIDALDNRMAPADDGSLVITGSTGGTDFVLFVPAGGGTNTVIAEQGQTVPGMSTTFGFNPSDVMVSNDSIAFSVQTFGPIGSSTNEFVFLTPDLGATVTPLLQEGVSTFVDPVRGTTETFDELDGEFTQGRDGVLTRHGHYLLSGDTDASTDDDVLVYDGVVKARENQPLAPFGKAAQNFNPVLGMNLSGSGQRWIARGIFADGQHFVLADDMGIASGLSEVASGLGEFWIDIGAGGFNNVAIDDDGTAVVGGKTNVSLGGALVSIDPATGEARTLSRAGDALDLDGNGRFDDNAIIDGYENDSVVILGNGDVIVQVLVGDPRFAPQDFSGGRRIGEAIIVLNLGLSACVCELTLDDITDVFDLLAYLAFWFAGDAEADIDGNPGVDVFDLLFFLDCWFPGCA